MNNCKWCSVFLALVFLSSALLLGGCGVGASRSLTGAELLALLGQDDGPVIVDVRSAGEFARGHIPGALHIPFYAVGSRHQEISADKDRPVLVYCAHGPRAWWAASVLRRQGFNQVTTLSLSGNQQLLPLLTP